MASIDPRRLDDSGAEGLERHAWFDGHPLEGEVRHILHGAAEDDLAAKRAAFLAATDRLRRKTEERRRTPAEAYRDGPPVKMMDMPIPSAMYNPAMKDRKGLIIAIAEYKYNGGSIGPTQDPGASSTLARSSKLALIPASLPKQDQPSSVLESVLPSKTHIWGEKT